MRIGRSVVSLRRAAVCGALLGLLACALVLALRAGPAIAAECPNEQLRKESNVAPGGQPFSTALPDCRAYEMVSPVEKQQHGAGEAVSSQGPAVLPIAVSPEGGTAGWSSEGDFLDPNNFALTRESALNGYLSQRGEFGWSTFSAFPPRSVLDGPSPNEGGLEGDLSLDLRSEHASCGVSPSGEGERLGAGQSLVCALSTDGGTWMPAPAEGGFQTVSNTSANSQLYLGGTPDLSRLYVQPQVPLQLERGEDKAPSSNPDGIYEIAGAGTASPYLRLVNVNNSGGELLQEAAGGGLLGPLLGAEQAGVHGNDFHAISESGGVFFTAVSRAGTAKLTIYARIHCAAGSRTTCQEDGNGEYLETVDVSNPSPSGCTETACPRVCTTAQETELEPPLLEEECQGFQPATYEGASADGSKVFFTTKQRLLNSDGDQTADLYEYDFNKRDRGEDPLVQLSAGGAGDATPGAGASVVGVVRTSSDGSHVYFVAQGVLTTEKNKNGEEATKGQHNLYGYDTVTGKTRFIATTPESFAAEPFDVEGRVQVGATENEIEETDYERKAQTTPNGRDLVFTSPAKLQVAEQAKKAAGEPPKESNVPAVYRYDFETGDLTWVSHPAPVCGGPECAPVIVAGKLNKELKAGESTLELEGSEATKFPVLYPFKVRVEGAEGAETFEVEKNAGNVLTLKTKAAKNHAASQEVRLVGEKAAYVAARPAQSPGEIGAYADVEDWMRAMSGLKVGEAGEEYEDQNDGEYIVFTTNERLQNNDLNEGVNVYEWHCSSPCQDPTGQGEATGEGTVHMISDGQDSEHGVAFQTGAQEAGATMSANGADIFFTTDTRLVGQDQDVVRDVYDARLGGGYPAPPAVSSIEAGSGPSAGGAPVTIKGSGFVAPATVTIGGAAAADVQVVSLTEITAVTPGGIAGSAAVVVSDPRGISHGGPSFTYEGSTAPGFSPPASTGPAGGNLTPAASGTLAFKTTAPKPLTKAQKLAKALKACKAEKKKKKRKACESQARKKYGKVVKKAKKGKAKAKKDTATKSKRSGK